MCTRIFWSDNKVADVVARTMDWAVSDEPKLWSLPAGLTRGGVQGTISWRSAYRSVALSMWDCGTVDGMNEHGLAAHLLYLEGAGYGEPDTRPALANTLWAQWALDNCATVSDAVAALAEMAVVSIPVRGREMGGHLALEDATGDSAILEPIDGKLTVHHGHEFRVMANAPTFDEQLANLARYAPFGGTLPPPGDITSLDRFVRASYFLHHLPAPADPGEVLARVIQLATNAAVPAGAPYDDGGVYPTWWIAAADVTSHTYYHWSMTSPTLTWLESDAADGAAGVQAVDVSGGRLAGDLSRHLEPAQLAY